MSKFLEVTKYQDKDKGKIVFVEDKKFGDNYYLVLDKDSNVLDRIPQQSMKNYTNLSELLNSYSK